MTTLRQILAEALEGERYVVVQAAHALDALELAGSLHPDLILLDLTLPHGSGIEVLHQLKSSAVTCEIPVLIMSGYTLVFTDEATRQADGFVSKPSI
jgi:CheY-like chemotaxis protein